MSNDELVWTIIGNQFCCFRAKVADNERDFCRNEHNVTGLCDRRSCPLANSRYATIREENGKAVLYIKTVERAHMPNRLWEKRILPQNYAQALAVVDEELAYWPKFLVLKNKQRLTKIHQLLIRMRKLRKEKNVPRLERVNQKDERREKRREEKALTAAKLERSIEKELLERLKQGTYGDIYNYPAQAYEKALREADAEFEENEEEEEIEDEQRVEFVEGDFSDDDDEDIEDWNDQEDFEEKDESEDDSEEEPNLNEDEGPRAAKAKRPADKDILRPAKKPAPPKPKPSAASRKGPYVEIEYEREEEQTAAQTSSSHDW
jgi:protein MAK16